MLEIEALTEIYESNIFSYQLNKLSHEISGEFIAYNKIVEDREIVIIGNNQRFEVIHLPPIYLKFKFNIKDENNKLDISLNSMWLPRMCLRILHDKLIELIEENEDSRLWLCCEFLENDALRVAADCNEGCPLEINVNDLNPFDTEEKINESIELLINFNNVQDDSIFKKTIMECDVCMTPRRGCECSRFAACQHVACTECLVDHFNTRISMGFFNLSCPTCGDELDYTEVRRVMDSQSFERWNTLSFQSCVKTMDDHRACPRCQTFIAIIAEDGYGFCRPCRHTFCLNCKETFNGPKCCHNLTADDPELMRQRRINKIFHTKKNMKNMSRSELNEMEKAYGEFKVDKRCPNCLLVYEKNGGCNHMNCPICKTHFCYLCNEDLSAADPYSHFKNKCKLFEVPKGRR